MGDPKSILKYNEIIKVFEDKLLNDFETSSYFHNKNLQFAIDHKNKNGEIDAYKGLGVCEQKVLNTHNAMKYLEIALTKAMENNNNNKIKSVSTDLIDVY